MPIKDIYKRLIDPNYTPTNKELDELSSLAGGFTGGGLVLKGPNAARNAHLIRKSMQKILSNIPYKSNWDTALAFIKSKYPKLSSIARFSGLPSEYLRIKDVEPHKGIFLPPANINVQKQGYPIDDIINTFGHELKHFATYIKNIKKYYMVDPKLLEIEAENMGNVVEKIYDKYRNIISTRKMPKISNRGLDIESILNDLE